MDNFLEALLDLSKNNYKSNFIESSDMRGQGIAGELGVNLNINSDRYYKQELLSWVSGDETVGLYAHYFDNNLLAISTQYARKSSETYAWSRELLKTEFTIFLLQTAWENFDIDNSLFALYSEKHFLEERLREIDEEIYCFEQGKIFTPTRFIFEINYEEIVKNIFKNYHENGYNFDESQYQAVKNLLNKF